MYYLFAFFRAKKKRVGAESPIFKDAAHRIGHHLASRCITDYQIFMLVGR